MEAIGTFLMDQVLKMQWLSDLIAGLLGAAVEGMIDSG